jgi:BarA-like signal transduction histidine kinase
MGKSAIALILAKAVLVVLAEHGLEVAARALLSLEDRRVYYVCVLRDRVVCLPQLVLSVSKLAAGTQLADFVLL